VGTIKNGTSIYDIKDYLTKDIAPTYFSQIADMNEMNVGLFGYITEILANTINDGYFTITSLFKEIFPIQAELPESIYNHATIFQIDNLMANSATVPFTLTMAEDALLKNGINGDGNIVYFDIDSDMIFNIEDIPFMLDYDIRVTSKRTLEGITHSAYYIMDHVNGISPLKNPYIRTSTFVNDNGKRYVVLNVELHQVQKKTITDTIITNDKINLVSMEYKFEGQLANFEVFYKAPGDLSYTQLTKKLVNTEKLDKPFCFYKINDEHRLQIEFSNDDRYFTPKYNSEIYIQLYTTKGKEGNFNTYDGTNIEIIGKSDKYPNNRGMIFMGTVTGAATGGYNRKEIEELRNEVVKAYSTIKSFTTTNDLQIYFNNIRHREQNEILFMKKRDDAFERLYSTFILFRDRDENVIPTNTLDIKFESSDVDVYMEQSKRNIIKAGKLFKYKGKDKSVAVVDKSLSLRTNLDGYEDSEFIYINPFLTVVCTNPLSVAFYLNSVNDNITTLYQPVDTNSFNQFIVNNINIKRDALNGEDGYTITTKIAPSAMLPKEAFKLVEDDTLVLPTDRTFVNPTDGYTYIDNKNLKVVLTFHGEEHRVKRLVDMDLYGFDEDYYFFKKFIKTNDYVSLKNQIQLTEGMIDPDTGEESTDPYLAAGTDCKIELLTFYKYPDTHTTQLHKFNNLPFLQQFTLTNRYIMSKDTKARFIIPVPEVRSYVQYANRGANGKFGFRLEMIPLIKANYFKLPNARENFMDSFRNIYDYIRKSLDLLTNNFHIDMKFFNTYGYSKFYFKHEDLEEATNPLDKINISISFDVKYTFTTDAEDMTKRLKEYIKKYIESREISLVSSPSLYVSNLIAGIKDNFPSIKFIKFNGINKYGPGMQTLESLVNETNVIQGVIETSKVIPEYLNVDYIIRNGKRTPQIFINILD
jgi:hypothetical protein